MASARIGRRGASSAFFSWEIFVELEAYLRTTRSRVNWIAVFLRNPCEFVAFETIGEPTLVVRMFCCLATTNNALRWSNNISREVPLCLNLILFLCLNLVSHILFTAQDISSTKSHSRHLYILPAYMLFLCRYVLFPAPTKNIAVDAIWVFQIKDHWGSARGTLFSSSVAFM
jgi:hypothetical protein